MNKNLSLLTLFLIVFNNSVFAQPVSNRLYYPYVFAPSEGFVNKIERPYRQEICLNGRWDFQPVALPSDYRQGKGVAPKLPAPDAGGWDQVKIKIPSPWNINSFANRNLEGPDHRNYPSYPASWDEVKMAWMRKTVTIPPDWTDKQILLHFEAVAGFAEVYVNGNKVAENFDLFLPFDADVTGLAIPGETAEILVGIRSQSLFEDNSTIGRRIVPAGSMWGYHVAGIWQDVYLTAMPRVHISDVFVKPGVSKGVLEAEIEIRNHTEKEARMILKGDVREWINKAGATVHLAPEPGWELAALPALTFPEQKVSIPAGGSRKITVSAAVKEGSLAYWTPDTPNLYGLTFTLNNKTTADTKYERFGWREWTFDGTAQLLNGKPIELRGDSWHFMGMPQLTRRYAWAWFTALKDANANAVRPHAQVYPRFYLDMADEMGICVLAETAIWASDGGPKMDSPLFWENCKDHIRRMVLRDRNHAGVFGWSVSNENKPVILNVFNRPDLMPLQKEAWTTWRDIVRENDPTRPWISSDGEDDGDGILPTTMGHYGDNNSMRHWQSIGKPWGVGEHSMAYYGTPEQVSKYNGERAYESQLGRMEGLAYECYDLVARQRNMGASYVSVFNIAWYGLQPLPFGKRDLSASPTIDDGIHFADYKEGVPGVQPERIGPYCSTLNPGYDPSLPLYIAWPMFDAIRAANAPEGPAWSRWAQMPSKPVAVSTAKTEGYRTTLFVGTADSPVREIFESHGVVFAAKMQLSRKTLIIADGSYMPEKNEIALLRGLMDKGADLWLWRPLPETKDAYSPLLPGTLQLDRRTASSFIPEPRSWMRDMVNSDFYFSEIQQDEVSQYGIKGSFADEGVVLLNACNTNWRRWNRRAEELKTASVLRSENENKGAAPVFIKKQHGLSAVYVSTLSNFAATEKGYNVLEKLFTAAGIPFEGKKLSETLIDGDGSVKIANLFERRSGNRSEYSFWLWSPRPLDDLLIEPDMPKLDLLFNPPGIGEVRINRSKIESVDGLCRAIPLKQGWNNISVSVQGQERVAFSLQFKCGNNPGFIRQLKTAFNNPDE